MEVLRYTEAQKKKLKTFEWQSRQNATFGMRSIKMLRPICHQCQNPPEHPRNWFEVCDHFAGDQNKMYWTLQPKIIKTPVYGTDEDGDMILEAEEVRTKLIMVPNWTEVPADTRHNDGKGPEKMRTKGFKFPEEVGVAPMCQSFGCGKAWPTIRTMLGDYCNELHAKLAIANENEINLVATNQRIRIQQLREIAI